MSNKSFNRNKELFTLIISIILSVCLICNFFGFSSFTEASGYNIYDEWYLSGAQGLNSSLLYKEILDKTGVNVQTKVSDDIVVAVIDSGLDMNNPYFDNALWQNTKEINGISGVDDDDNGVTDDYSGAWFSIKSNIDNYGSSDFSDCMAGNNYGNYWHGTHVAGIIHSVAPNVKIMPIRAGEKIGDKCNFTAENVIISLLYAADNGADIINLSLGTTSSSFANSRCNFYYKGKQINMSIQEAINYAVNEKNAMVVAAAGNNGLNTAFYPASCENVVSVMASTRDGDRWAKSNYSKDFDIMAPGAEIISTIGYNTISNVQGVPKGYGTKNGTSMASPYVAGVAALLMSCSDVKTGKEMAKYLTSESFLSYVEISDNIGYKNKLLDYSAISKLLDGVIDKKTEEPIEDSLITRMTVFDKRKLTLSLSGDFSGEMYWYVNGKFKTVGPKCSFVPTEDAVVEVRINNELVKVFYITVKSYNAYVGIITGGVIGGAVGIAVIAIIVYMAVNKKKNKKT